MAQQLYGRLTLIVGSESFLSERASSRLVAEARQARPDLSVTSTPAEELSPGAIDQMAGADLFSSATVAIVSGAEKTPKGAEAALIALARDSPDNVALIVAHAGGNQGKSLPSARTGLASEVIDTPPVKAWNLAKFVGAEVRAAGKSIPQDAAQQLVDAVGGDLKSLAGAVAQLVADTEEEHISTAAVATYFSGRASVTAFSVSDDTLSGRVSDAIVKLRWALSTGVPHVLVTSALANSLRQIGNYLSISRLHQPTAQEVGVPAWKIKDLSAMAHAWSEKTIAPAIRAVSQADAQIKGASQDPDFALERLILRLASLRRASHGR